MQSVTEFFAPFAHVPGRYEVCRIRSPTHGVFDSFIVLGESTSVPATVYVASDAGGEFMAQRYPECATLRADHLGIDESDDALTVRCALRASIGPIRKASIRFQADAGTPREVPYGAQDRPVWGSRWACTGVDLELDARVTGHLHGPDVDVRFEEDPGILTVGSYGHIRPLNR